MSGTRLELAREMEGLFILRGSLQNFHATLHEQFSKRPTNEIRAIKQGVSAAIMAACPDGKKSLLARVTGTSVERLTEGKKRWDDWLSGDEESLVEFRGKIRSDKLLEVWCALAVSVWLNETRPSPNKKDSVRDPKNR